MQDLIGSLDKLEGTKGESSLDIIQNNIEIDQYLGLMILNYAIQNIIKCMSSFTKVYVMDSENQGKKLKKVQKNPLKPHKLDLI